MRRQRLAYVEIEVDPQSADLPGEELLVDVLRQMLGRGWDIEGWKSIAPRIDRDGRHFYRLEFVFTPDNRTNEERQADRDAGTTAAHRDAQRVDGAGQDG